jgi:hypothetical protein
MLTIDNIKRIEGQVVRIQGLDWKIIGATDMADGKPQYQFYLNHGSNFRTIYLDRNWASKTNLKGMLYKLHTSANGVFVSNEELRSVGSTMYWLERVCE